MARKRELHVAPKPSELTRVRGFADAAALRFGLDPRERHDFTVAANEAVANAIRHGQPCDDDTIHVWVTEQEGALTLGVQVTPRTWASRHVGASLRHMLRRLRS